MKKVQFDDYAKNYDTLLTEQLEFFEADNEYFAKYKVSKAKSVLTKTPKTILDFGCGIGRSTVFLQEQFPQASIYGCDPSEKCLNEAKARLPSACFLLPEQLYDSNLQFDFIFIACVFHHVPPMERLSLLDKLSMVCNVGANIMVFEHNPFNPLTRRLVKNCPFDQDAILLMPRELKMLFKHAGLEKIRCDYTLFFPGFLQRLRSLEHYLRFLPLGGQYVISGQIQDKP